MLTDSPFPKNFALKTKIVIYNSSKRLRHLDQIEKEIILKATDDSNGNGKTIIRFISDEEFDTNGKIQIKEIVSNNDKLTNSVTENNNFSIADFSSDLKQSNTKDVLSLIEENKIIDLSNIKNSENDDRNIISFNLNKINGCELNFKSEKSASFSENQLTIELDDNNGNIVKAQCDLEKDDINTIKCVISDEIENGLTLKDAIIYSAQNYIIISGNGDILDISCKKQEQKNKSINLLFIMSIIIIVLIVLIVYLIIYICFCKSEKGNSINKKIFEIKNKRENKNDNKNKRENKNDNKNKREIKNDNKNKRENKNDNKNKRENKNDNKNKRENKNDNKNKRENNNENKSDNEKTKKNYYNISNDDYDYDRSDSNRKLKKFKK